MSKPVPDLIWVPLTAAGLVALVGLAGYLAGMPWLFPSLGPTAYLQTTAPRSKEARLYNAIGGHYVSAAAAVFAVWLTGASINPPMDLRISGARVAAATIGIALGILADRIWDRRPYCFYCWGRTKTLAAQAVLSHKSIDI